MPDFIVASDSEPPDSARLTRHGILGPLFLLARTSCSSGASVDTSDSSPPTTAGTFGTGGGTGGEALPPDAGSRIRAEHVPGEHPAAPFDDEQERALNPEAGSDADAGADTTAERCPDGMAHVVGEFCTETTDMDHVCEKWIDPENAIARRCAVYRPGTKCRGGRTAHLDFCIDRREFAEPDGRLPLSNVSFTRGRALCAEAGKRLCTTDEWTYACEGPERLPYPYGYERRADKCNIDRYALVQGKELVDQRQPVDANLACASPFGVMDMTGNVGEWTFDTRAAPPFRSAGKGGWWGPLRNRCRATTVGHDEYFAQVQIGFRCCR